MRLISVISALVIISCGNPEPDQSKIVGVYTNGPDSTNYNYFIFRPDYTYSGLQSWHWGDNMFGYAGEWELKNDTVILYQGHDFGDKLAIKSLSETKSDSLTIDVSSLLNYDKNIRVSTDYIDLPIVDGQIKIYKPDFWKGLDARYYQGHLLSNIDIRLKNGFATIASHLTDRDLIISLMDNSRIDVGRDSVLCKYFRKDSILFSTNEHFSLARHNLRRTK